jgi:hypothetical protein
MSGVHFEETSVRGSLTSRHTVFIRLACNHMIIQNRPSQDDRQDHRQDRRQNRRQASGLDEIRLNCTAPRTDGTGGSNELRPFGDPVSIRVVLVSYTSEQFTSASVKPRVSGSGDHSGADRTSDRAGAVLE